MITFLGRNRSIDRGAAALAAMVIILYGGGYAQSAAEDRPGGTLAAGPSGMGAQAVSERAGQPAADPDLAAAIVGKKKVRVLTPSGPMVLRRPEMTSDGLSFRAGRRGQGKPWVIPWTDVNAVQVRRSGVGKGAILGAGIGAGLGLAFGLACTRECTGWMDMFCDATAGEVVLVTAIGGASGGLLGAVLGTLTGSWGTVYTKAKPLQIIPRISVAPAPRGGWIFSLSLSL